MPLSETISNYIGTYIGTSAGPFESAIITAAVILFSSFILAYIADFVFEKIFKRLVEKTKFTFDDLIIAALKKPIFYSVIILGIYMTLEVIYPTGKYTTITNNIFLSILTIIWSIAAVNVNKILFKHVFAKVVKKTKTELDNELMPLIKNITGIIIIFIGLMIILKSIWGFDITPFLASAGILGFAVAFAAKDAISHLFGGLSIYFDKPFKKGDRIEIGEGEIGIVEEVGVRSTRIRNFYNNMIIIPNSQIANSKIINYNSPESKMMVKVPIGVAYGSDVAKVKKILLKIANSIEEVLEDPVPSVRFDNHGESSLDFVIVMWVDEPIDKIAVIDKANTLIDKEFKKAKIDIPFPTRTIIQKR